METAIVVIEGALVLAWLAFMLVGVLWRPGEEPPPGDKFF